MSTCLVACVLFSCHVCLCQQDSVTLFIFSFIHSDLRGSVCACMGARERGRVAANSPLALRPVPVSSATVRARDCGFFWSGFIFAFSLISWILFGIVHVDQPGTLCSV